MKTLLLASIITISGFTSQEVKANRQNFSEYKGKAQLSLTYLGTGWSSEYNCSSTKASIDGSMFSMLLGGGAAMASGVILPVGVGVVAIGFGAYTLINCTDTNKIKQDTLNADLTASIIESTNERVTLSLQSKKKNGCAGFAFNTLGEDDGFGNYELYANKEAYLENKSIGTMTKNGKKLLINITEDMTIITKGKKGFDCRWDLTNGFSAELKK